MNDKLAHFSETPDINEFIVEYRRALDEGLTLQNVRDAEDIRFARWTGQSDDGKNGARIYLKASRHSRSRGHPIAGCIWPTRSSTTA